MTATAPLLGTLRVVPLDSSTRSAWDEFVSKADGAWIYHRAAWSMEVLESLGHRSESILALDDNGTVQGVLPLGFRTNWLFGSSLVSIPGASWAGLLAQTAEAAEILTKKLQEIADRRSAGYIECRDGRALPAPFEPHGNYCRFPVYLEGLGTPPLPDTRTQRRLRKATEAGVMWTVSREGLAEFYSIYAQAMARLGSPPFSFRFFEAIHRAFPDSVRVLLVSSGSTPVAADLVAYWRGFGGSLFAGATDIGRQVQADLVAIRGGLEEAVRLGCTSFDLGRSPAGSGGQVFKEHWGARAVPLTYWSAAAHASSLPDLNPERSLWRLARSVWRKMPGRLQISLGSRIAPHLL